MDRRDISKLLDEPEDEGKDREQALQTLMTEKFEKYQTVFRWEIQDKLSQTHE